MTYQYVQTCKKSIQIQLTCIEDHYEIQGIPK